MASKSFKDATRSLQDHFAAKKPPPSLPAESRRMLQTFVDEYEDGKVGEEESSRANAELRTFWEKHVRDSPSKLGAFAGVLRELRPVIAKGADVLEWWNLAVKPVLTTIGYRKAALDDAQDFLVNSMIYDDSDGPDEEANRKRAKDSQYLLSELLKTYIARTEISPDETELVAPENATVAQQIENVLVAFGRKQPKSLFHALDDFVTVSTTRLQALTLLTSFLRHQTPHLYLVINTPLVEHLLKCLMNDTSTAALSAALTSLLMLLPHIPGSLVPHLPRLFLIYSRLLCWEKFSPLSTEAQRNLVTDDRVAADPEEEIDDGDVGIDPTWDKLVPTKDLVEASTPELMTLFTYLYGMYPLNFLSYIRKSRRYLKNLDFPGAEDFDLDQAVIRSRTEQFRQVHLVHPNFYNMTIEEELIDPKWPKADPADVVAECHSLCVNPGSSLASPGPPPTCKLPDPPLLPAVFAPRSGRNSPIVHDTTVHSTTNSWLNARSASIQNSNLGADSPIIKPNGPRVDDDVQVERLRPRSKASAHTESSFEDFAYPGGLLSPQTTLKEKPEHEPQTNLAYLQRENTLLRNELNFERWHKGQYSQHISQLVRKNVKDATAEAETLNLINANRALKQQLEQLRSAREATIKDSALTRKQANSLETNMTERLAKMKKDQEKWLAEVDELRRLREEAKEFRGILSTTEERELNKSMELKVIKREMEQMDKIRSQLHEAQRKIREYEYRDFEFERTKREMTILQNEKHAMQMRVRTHEQERERTQRIYMGKVAELEAQLESLDPFQRSRSPTQSPPEMFSPSLRTASDSDAKLAQLKKAHARLLEKFTDLELEYQSAKSQLEEIQQGGGHRGSQSYLRLDPEIEGYDFVNSSRKPSNAMMSGSLLGSGAGPGTATAPTTDYSYDMLRTDLTPSAADSDYVTSTSDPTNRRYQGAFRSGPVSPPFQQQQQQQGSEAAVHSTAGLTFHRPPPPSASKSLASRNNSIGSRNSTMGATSTSASTSAPSGLMGPGGLVGSGGVPALATSTSFNPSAPLSEDEMARSMVSAGSGETVTSSGSLSKKNKEKIQPDSVVRVYGRGGAQNIKMKSKDKDKLKTDKPKSSPLKGLRGFI